MEKLTLEQLASYLPYGLKIFNCDIVMNGSMCELLSSQNYSNRKPILNPMSDLPCQMLSDLNFNFHKDYLTIEREHWISLKGDEEWLNDIPFGRIQWFAKNHYDYQGLIEKGLAIPIHDVKEA